MKTAAKVFLIISMVFCLLNVFTIMGLDCLSDTISQLDKLEYISSISWLIIEISLLFSTLICFIAYTQLSTCTLKNDIVIVSIFTLIFGNLIAGIIMLAMQDKDLQ